MAAKTRTDLREHLSTYNSANYVSRDIEIKLSLLTFTCYALLPLALLAKSW